MVEIAALKGWIGREVLVEDVASPATLQRLAALLDHDRLLWPVGTVPPLGHWLYFLPRARQSELGVDGHARRGAFLPPVPLPRRMWAGGAISFEAPIPLGAAITRRSTIADVTHKTGASGSLVFVTLGHEISTDGIVAVRERQDLVYCEAAGGAPTVAEAVSPRPCDASRTILPDPTLLFRYSALTFNAHRIHFDREYAHDEEGYAGLVVQGPLIATLLVDLLLRHAPSREITHFAFRARRPLLDTAPFTLCLAESEGRADLWSCDAAGNETMTACAS